jgi:hypothetical protein
MGQGGRGKPPEGGGQGGHGADPRHTLRAQVRAPQHRNVQPHLQGNVHVHYIGTSDFDAQMSGIKI